MLVYRHRHFPSSRGRFSVLQEYLMRPFIVLFMIYAGILIFLIASHQPILIFGLAGVFVVLMLGNVLGNAYAKGQYLEIGFHEGFFYMRSAYDIAFQKILKYYPLVYANATHDGELIYVNYIDQVVKIRSEDWNNGNDLWQIFSRV